MLAIELKLHLLIQLLLAGNCKEMLWSVGGCLGLSLAVVGCRRLSEAVNGSFGLLWAVMCCCGMF